MFEQHHETRVGQVTLYGPIFLVLKGFFSILKIVKLTFKVA
jgi:hypothetical protein